jgi:hypothetical protein
LHPICLLKPHQFAKAKEIKHRLLVSVPREKYPPWLRNAFKQAYRNIQRLEALGPPVKGALPQLFPILYSSSLFVKVIDTAL